MIGSGSFDPVIARRCRADERLKQQLDAIGAGGGLLLFHEQIPWASITFSGVRHKMEYAFEGEEAVRTGLAFAEALPEREFDISGHLVADAVVTRSVWRTMPPRLELEIEILLLEED